MKRAQKKAAAAAATNPAPSSTTEAEPKIVATSQQSRFHRETLVTTSKDIDMHTVNITVNNLDLLVDAHLRLKEGVRYGLVGQNGVGKTSEPHSVVVNLFLSCHCSVNEMHGGQYSCHA
jgi:ABC-type molybdenum transport system ATPase subunit/photorepair protein PhrA